MKWYFQAHALSIILFMAAGSLLYYSFVLAQDSSMQRQLALLFTKDNILPTK